MVMGREALWWQRGATLCVSGYQSLARIVAGIRNGQREDTEVRLCNFFFSSLIKISSSHVSNFHHHHTESHSCLFLGQGHHHKCREQDNNMCQEKNKTTTCVVRLSNNKFFTVRLIHHFP